MTCGDTEVAIWEALWEVHAGHPCWLSYDVLLVRFAPRWNVPLVGLLRALLVFAWPDALHLIVRAAAQNSFNTA